MTQLKQAGLVTTMSLVITRYGLNEARIKVRADAKVPLLEAWQNEDTKEKP